MRTAYDSAEVIRRVLVQQPAVQPDSPFAMAAASTAIAMVLAQWFEGCLLVASKDYASYIAKADEFVIEVLRERQS